MELQLLLERFAYLPAGTFGKLLLPNGSLLSTAEKPWLNNTPFKSCIPEGKYLLAFRESATIRRTSNDKHSAGWEITGVPGRDHVLLHPGNWPSSVEGCVAVGKTFGLLKDPQGDSPYGVISSQGAFEELMATVIPSNVYHLTVASKRADVTA